MLQPLRQEHIWRIAPSKPPRVICPTPKEVDLEWVGKKKSGLKAPEIADKSHAIQRRGDRILIRIGNAGWP
jgi:hypothetical protein